MIYYHIHINIFKISKCSKSKLLDAGYFCDPFIPLESSYTPPEHYSCETSDKKLIEEVWNKGLAILQLDNEFEGYIEYEVLSKAYSIKYMDHQVKNPKLVYQFPLPHYKTINVPPNKHKQADLHVKRHEAAPSDELDTLLLKSGFYEVRTPRNRIYTLQLESAKDAKLIFTELKDYFNLIGGIKQLNFEIVKNLVRFPSDFKMAKYLPKGQNIIN